MATVLTQTLSANTAITFDISSLGTSSTFVAGRGDFAAILKDAKNPLVILGAGALTRPDGAAIAALARAAGVAAVINAKTIPESTVSVIDPE